MGRGGWFDTHEGGRIIGLPVLGSGGMLCFASIIDGYDQDSGICQKEYALAVHVSNRLLCA